MKKVLIFLFFILTTCYLLRTTALAHAASLPQLSVTPSLVSLDLATDKPEATLTYTNLTNQPMELSFQAQDFTQLENGYQLSFLSPKDANNYKYGLSSWIHFSNTSLILDPHQSGTVTVTIAAQKLSPGGHYATILATINPDSSSIQQINLKGVLGSLLFVRTHTGQEIETAALPSFAINRNLLDFPTTIYFRFDNTGDVDLTPYGLVEITNSFGTIVAKGIINQTSAPTLPESIRRYYVTVNSTQPFLFPGWYHATVSLHFGQANKKLSQTIVFFSQGSIPCIPLALAAFVISVGFLWYKKRKTSKLKHLKWLRILLENLQ